MRAVVITSDHSGNGALGALSDLPLALLADRPFLDHVCETLVRSRVTVVDWVSPPNCEAALDFLGDGTRWGVRFKHHAAASAAHAYQIVGRLLAGRADGEALVLGRGDCLVTVLAPAGASGPATVLYDAESDPIDGPGSDQSRRWSGWATVSGRAERIPAISDERQLESHLVGEGDRTQRVAALDALDFRTLGGYLAANRAALGDLAPPIPGCVGNWPPGVRVAPSARVHPLATLIGPVFIGAGSEIAARATIGPNVAVGADCIIDRGVVITDTAVLPGTYIGEDVRLDCALVAQGRVITLGKEGAALVTTGVAVASLTDHLPARLTAIAARSRDRIATWGARAVETVRALRRSIRDGLGGANTGGREADAVPLPTATD